MAHTAVLIDLTQRSTNTAGEPQWAYESEDLDLTLLAWNGEQQIPTHTNGEVDVLMIAITGAGEVRVGEDLFRLLPGQALLIPRGSERSVRCSGEQFAYLSVHRRRRGLWPTLHGQPLG